MNNRRGRVLKLAIFTGIVAFVGWFTMLHSYVPQTITVDGSNDFLVANVMDPDGYDCEATATPIDFDTVFVTNDANKLYIGFQYNKGGWTSNQLGIMFSVSDTSGGTTDAWGHAVAWNSAPHKPDYQAWCNMDNSWQELREWNSGASSWDIVYSGTGSLGWINNTGFEELGLNLSDLGLSMGDTVYIELISTQNGSTKGPLDAMANDDQQLSTPSGTVWDTTGVVQLDSMVMYTIQTAGDTVPPVVDYAVGDDACDANTDIIDLIYSEPVDQTTAETAGNYALTGTAVTINYVELAYPSPCNRVRIHLNSTIGPQANFYSVEVTNVKDLNNNTIVDNNTTNVACFFIKGLLFRGHMGLHLRQHSFPTDTFTVEGNLGCLTWAGCDNAFMTHLGDSTYEALIGFSLIGEDCPGTPSADTTLEWKFMHQCYEYEPLAFNRQHVLSSGTGAYDTLDVWWNDQGPEYYTGHPIDVIFHCDVNSMFPSPDTVVAINGSVLPLTFDVPSITNMVDDGNPPDDTAGDGIYAVTVRFPAYSFKTVNYKYLFNDVYECLGIGDREVWLNDAAYDTVGGAMGPLEMPLQYYDRCITIGRNVEVVFKVDACLRNPGVNDTIAVNGTPNNQLPPVINWNIPSINPMQDNGIYPDDIAGDMIYAVSVIFPDSSDKLVEYKYLFNSEYECSTQSNRYFYIDDYYDAVGNPQVLELDYWNSCDVVGVPDDAPRDPFVLHQNFPNPFNPTTTIKFNMPFTGRAVLRVYNVKGELVKTLLDGVVGAGPAVTSWDGKDHEGRDVASGVYFYNLRIDGKNASRKMVLIR